MKMKIRNDTPLKILILILIICFPGLAFQSRCQELHFSPKGDPDYWHFSVTPFVLIPYVTGNVQSERLSGEFGIGPSDFINTLKGAFMIDAELAKGRFFISPAYIYTNNEVEQILWTSENGEQIVKVNPALKKNIVELIGGMRYSLAGNFMLDPFAGFRYTGYSLSGSAEGILNTAEIDEKEAFWDPVIGLQAHYYPDRRIPVELKTDIGGFGVGSQLTWSVMLNSGYILSPSVDLIAGFAALSNKYEKKTATGNTFGLTSVTYGFTMGARFYIPKRANDPTVFKKR
jgi:hypothetical protein